MITGRLVRCDIVASRRKRFARRETYDQAARGGDEYLPAATVGRFCFKLDVVGQGRMTKRKPDAKLGRPPVPIERNPQRFEIACWWAFHEMGCGPFDAARRALLAVKGGTISMADIDGVLRLSQVAVPLPDAKDEPNAAERRLFAMAKRQRAEPWLVHSSALVQGLIVFIGTRNLTGACTCLDNLLLRGWRPVLAGLRERIETALESNVPPANVTALGPQARKLVERLTGVKFPKRKHRKK